MNGNILPDTPWHIGYAKKKGNDPRRHKSRCTYYENGECSIRCCKCGGSSHCPHYSERELEQYQSISYRLIHNERVWAPQEIRKFCIDSTQEGRKELLQNMLVCPICNGKLQKYEPLFRMVKMCNVCKVLYINDAVYATYKEEVNRALGNYLLCTVGIEVPKKIYRKK